MDDINSDGIYEFIIIGGGIAGAIAFYEFSKLGKTILLESNDGIANPTNELNAKILCKHGFSWLEEAPWADNNIFLRDHVRALYRSKNNDGLVNGAEFNEILGKVVNLPMLIQWYIDEGKSNGGEVNFNTKIQKLDNSSDLSYGCLTTSENHIIKGSLIILATGSSDFTIQQKLGLPIPETLNAISTTFSGNTLILDENLPSDYMFQLHPQISQTGMLWMTRGNNFFNMGFVSNESETEMRQKFLRIIQKYEKIRPFFKNVQPSVNNLTANQFKFQKTTKFPISKFSTNRVLVVGDAGGLFYSLYLEGILGAIISSKIASQVVKKMQLENKEYSKNNLTKYDEILQKNLIKPYLEAGVRGNSLFFDAHDNPKFTVWDAYMQVIKKNSRVRKNIVTAFTFDDLPNYPVENDDWCGEQIYHELPLGKRIALTPIFLKQKFQKK